MAVIMSPRDARALKIGVVLVLPILMLQLIVRPYRSSMLSRGNALRAEVALLRRELAMTQSRARLDSLANVAESRRGDIAELLFEGGDAVAASAALARYISEGARRATVSIQAIEIGSDHQLGDELTSIDVVVRGESDLEGILTFLRQLEYGARLLMVPAVRIEPVSGRDTDADLPTVLGVTITVRGYLLRAAGLDGKKEEGTS